MSELTKCNHCTLRWMKSDARRKGKKVAVRWDLATGMWVVLVGGEKAAWMLKITKKCAC